MPYFHYQDNQLFAERVNLTDIAAEFGTPCYVYSQSAIEHQWQAFNAAFNHHPHGICYAVKANSNLAILNMLARQNSGFDIVSLGELERVIKAGGHPSKIVFSGVGKSSFEIASALNADIQCFNVESEPELARIHEIAAEQNKIAKIALRINPNIDAKTHPYIATGLNENKFGLAYELAMPLVKKIQTMPHIKLIGIACHIGSQLTELTPFLAAIDKMQILIDQFIAAGVQLKHINIGGGLGVCYQKETPPSIPDYVAAILKKLAHYNIEIVIEPGRAIVANTGILLTKIEYLKHTDYKNFAIIDAAMNDLMRPALYDAWHRILPVRQRKMPEIMYDVVGPVCESSDFLGKDRPLAVSQGDLLAICSAGAYGFSMSSNYNSRPRAAEVLVKQDKMHLIRERETIAQLFSNERIIHELYTQ